MVAAVGAQLDRSLLYPTAVVVAVLSRSVADRSLGCTTAIGFLQHLKGLINYFSDRIILSKW